MAYPPSYYPISNKTMFHHVNWTWAPPGANGNLCERCGTHCFCAAEAGLLPKTRGALAAVHAVTALEAVQEAVQEAAQEAVVAPQYVLQDGIAAILQYDTEE
jgi:hypothetical protein